MAFILETERLTLRELTDEDHERLYPIYRDPAVSRTLGEPPPYDEYMRRARATWPAYYHQHGFGLWAAIRKGGGELMGRVGLLSLHVDGVDEVEVAYTLAPAFQGRGYATEAALACRDRAFRALGVSHVISAILPDNAPSIRVAERIGMTFWKETELEGFHLVVYSITREEWERAAG